MELFTAAAAALGAATGLVAAIGVLIVNAKVDRLQGELNQIGEGLRAHVNTPGVHR